ncbi:Ger(x)C family spore germination protein [Brevibacillus humidisoli]|uniref:Ger(x)C family spore germination protein n=1 Tax=Brevibacillus humidisoli TaxID=2895522 RepID=UPI001E339A82|nr:Ger(x)C family spore germination protein [Brevibacillus humidisoli]UFJ40873.1 Ger(x)C family spore germination protein [Brevibacillus humidisoli]
MRPIKPATFRNLLILCCLITTLLSGCWDRQEIEERANVLGVAIDLIDERAEKREPSVSHFNGGFPEPERRMLQLTAQIAVPGRIPLGPEAGGGAPQQKPVWVLSVVGHTIDDAMMNLQQQLADRLFLGHLRVIIISEELARKGIRELNDYLRRNPEVRRTAWMLVANGRAAAAMEASPELERVPTLYLTATMNQAVGLGKFPNDFLGIFWTALSSKGMDPYLPYIKVLKKDNILIAGLAYFRGDQMVGVAEPMEIGFFMAVKGFEQGGYGGFTPVPGKEGSVLLRATRRHTKVNVNLKGGQPHFAVKVHYELEVDEKTSTRFSLNKPELLRKIEREAAQGAKLTIEKLIKKTKQKGSDIFGFGEYVRAKLPGYWNRHIGTTEKWRQMYKDVPVDVKVMVHIRRIGMKGR